MRKKLQEAYRRMIASYIKQTIVNQLNLSYVDFMYYSTNKKDYQRIPKSTMSKICNGKIDISESILKAIIETMNLNSNLEVLLPTEELRIELVIELIYLKLEFNQMRTPIFEDCLFKACNQTNDIERLVRNNKELIMESLLDFMVEEPNSSHELIECLIQWLPDLIIIILQSKINY